MYKRIILSLRCLFFFSVEYAENSLRDFIHILHVYVTGLRLGLRVLTIFDVINDIFLIFYTQHINISTSKSSLL